MALWKTAGSPCIQVDIRVPQIAFPQLAIADTVERRVLKLSQAIS
jgi:hypothetical protein